MIRAEELHLIRTGNMAFYPQKRLQPLVEAVRRHALIPLIGVGLSRQTGHPFPNWHGLLHIMKDRALNEGHIDAGTADVIKQHLDRGHFLLVAQHLRYRLPETSYYSLLRDIFFPLSVEPTEIHKALFRLEPRLILTTNYDSLLTYAYAEIARRSLHPFTYTDARAIQNHLSPRRDYYGPAIFNLNGSVDHLSRLIHTERDFREVIQQDTGFRAVLSTIFITHTVLMLGFSLEDRELMALLETLREFLRFSPSLHYILLPSSEADVVAKHFLREDYGIEVIPFDPSEEYSETLQLINFLASSLPPEKVVPEESSEKNEPKEQTQRLRIVVASPNDVMAERKAVSAVVEELNREAAKLNNVQLDVYRWETEAYPGFHAGGPPGLIDPLLKIEDCDILIVIFWKKFGTPTADSKSGTEHEFKQAYKSWKKRQRPQIMFYFNQKPYTPRSKEEAEQWSKVLEFREGLPMEGFWWSYSGRANFEELVREHLTRVIRVITGGY